jgi:hypothetical protein
VAELGASYLMADLGLAYTPRPDHAPISPGGWAPCVTIPRRSSTLPRKRRLPPTGSTAHKAAIAPLAIAA